jgi:hypothetical protein
VRVSGVTITGGIGSEGENGGGVVVNHTTGGAVPSSPTLTLTDSIVTANETDYGGGIAVYNYAYLSLVDTLVVDNVGGVAGGGLWMQNYGRVDCEATAVGAAGFVANTSAIGGGIYLSNSSNGTIHAVGCDWGSDTDGDDNADYDIQQAPRTSADAWCYGNASSLSETVDCAAASCTASSETCP